MSCCLTNMPTPELVAQLGGIESIHISTKAYLVSNQFTGSFHETEH